MPDINIKADVKKTSTLGKVKVLVEQVVGAPSQEAISQAVADYIEAHPGSLSPLSPAVKSALLQIAEKVAYVDDQGQDYYDALDAALNAKALLSITAVYTQSGTVYDTDSLNSLKADLVVTAYYDDGTTADVTSASVLSGTLTEGISTITVTYEGKTATFNVTVSGLLPDGYTAYDWLKGDGAAFLDTGLDAHTYGADAYAKYIKFKAVEASADNAKLFGNRNAFSTTGYYVQLLPKNEIPNTIGFCFWAKSVTVSATYDLTTPHEMLIANKQALVDSVVVGTGTNNTTTVTNTSMPITLFVDLTMSPGGTRYGSYYTGSAPCHATIYEFAITDELGDEVAHLYPAMRNSDNAIGMYDVVRNQFFTNVAASGAFTIGND